MGAGRGRDPHTVGRDRLRGTRGVHTGEAEFILFIFASPGPNSLPGTTRCYGDFCRKEKGDREEKNTGERVGEGNGREEGKEAKGWGTI